MTTPESNVIIAAIGGAASIIAALLAFLARGKVKQIHTLVNSRLTDEIAARKIAEARVKELEAINLLLVAQAAKDLKGNHD